MERQAIIELVKALFGPNTPVTNHRDWVTISCPFARWRHAGNSDRRASFGISINNGVSIANCLACNFSGTLPCMLQTLSCYTGESYKKLIEEIETNDFLGADLDDWEENRIMGYRQEAIDEAVYGDMFDPAAGHFYLKERDINDSTATLLGLGVDIDNYGAERIVFPVRGLRGELYGYTGRATDPTVNPKVRDYFGLPKRQCLLGAHLLSGSSFVLLVEGLFDYARMRQYGLPAVASMKASLLPYQAEILIEHGRPVYILYDNDQAGREGKKSVVSLLGPHLPILDMKYPDIEIDANNNTRQIKDPDELMYEEVRAMIENAELL